MWKYALHFKDAVSETPQENKDQHHKDAKKDMMCHFEAHSCNLCQWFRQAAGLLTLIKANQLLTSSTFKAPRLLFHLSLIYCVPFLRWVDAPQWEGISGKQAFFIGFKRRPLNSNWTIVTWNQNLTNHCSTWQASLYHESTPLISYLKHTLKAVLVCQW